MKLKFCRECKKCCASDKYSNVILSFDDVKKLKSKHQINSIENFGKLSTIKHSENCPFLEKNGCKLDYKIRPLDCRMFPLTFMFKDGKINFFFINACPHISKISKEWIENAKKEALENLKNWSDEEKEFYSEIPPCGKLIEIN